MGIGFFAWVVLGVVFAFVSNRQERDARSKPLPPLPRKTAFRVPWGARLFMAMLAIFFITGWPLMYAGDILNPGSHHPLVTAETWSLRGLLEMICIAVSLPLLYLSGPNEFFLDLDRRTYRHVYGWQFRPQVREGTFEEMAGVYVWCRQRNSQYIVGIRWKRPRSHSPVLGTFAGSSQASRYAEEIAIALGVPLVEPPPQCRNSTSGRNGLL